MMVKKKKKNNDETKAGSGRVAVSSLVNAASIIEKYSKNFGDQDIIKLMDALADTSKGLKTGDLSCIEEMLFTQAKALEAIFSRFARVAINCEFNQSLELNLRLALKAQSQCTRTLATLVAIKMPSNVSFVKQTNIGDNVQVNNSYEARKNQNSPNELLEISNEKRLVSGEASETSKFDPKLETMDKINRA